MRRALGRLADEPTYLQHALGPGVAARERRSVRHGPAPDRFVKVLGREVEVAGAKLLNHPPHSVPTPPPAPPPRPPAGPTPARAAGPRSPLPRAPHRHRAAGESAARSSPTAPPPLRSSTSSLDATQSHR